MLTRRGVVIVSVWAVLNVAAIVWLAAGNLHTGPGVIVVLVVATSVGYGVGRLIALRRIQREGHPLQLRMVPLRVCGAVIGLLAFGPLIAAAMEVIGILTAGVGFLAGLVLMPIAAALFSDGYQGLWLDSLVFHARLTPPEDDWVLKKR